MKPRYSKSDVLASRYEAEIHDDGAVSVWLVTKTTRQKMRTFSDGTFFENQAAAQSYLRSRPR